MSAVTIELDRGDVNDQPRLAARQRPATPWRSCGSEIDEIDSELVALIAERARFIDRAIVLKQRDGLPAYIPERVEEVVANVRKTARELGAPEHVVETIWRVMVDEFIAIESGRLAGPSATP